jgi:hypothetical protein
MKSIIDLLQECEPILTYDPFIPLGPIANLEVAPVKEYEDCCEVCPAGQEDFWSVYIRYDAKRNSDGFGGVDCIADCSGYEGAMALAGLIGALLGVEIVEM